MKRRVVAMVFCALCGAQVDSRRARYAPACGFICKRCLGSRWRAAARKKRPAPGIKEEGGVGGRH